MVMFRVEVKSACGKFSRITHISEWGARVYGDDRINYAVINLVRRTETCYGRFSSNIQSDLTDLEITHRLQTAGNVRTDYCMDSLSDFSSSSAFVLVH